MRRVIGIDSGGSKTVALLADEQGRVLAEARSGGANILLQGEGGVERALRGVLEELAQYGPAQAICLGIAGAGGPAERQRLGDVLARLRIGERVRVESDAMIALVAGAGEPFGVVAIAGTGSIAFGLDREGRSARAGGWGPVLADDGSVFWIARELLRRTVRALDGIGPPTLLVDLLGERLGIDLRRDLATWVHGSEGFRERAIPLAPLLEQAASRGDGVAAAILGEAAAYLVAVATNVGERLAFAESFPVVLSGGAYRACPSLVDRFRSRWESSAPRSLAWARITPLEVEPAIGAVKLALRDLELEPL